LYVTLFEAYTTGANVQAMKEILAPAGEKIYSVRLSGVGKMMLSVKENEDRLTLVNARTGEMEEFDWGDMKQALADNMDFEKSPEESWQKIYGEEFPKKEEVAPVQQKEEKKKAPRKESKVSKAKVEKPKEEKKEGKKCRSRKNRCSSRKGNQRRKNHRKNRKRQKKRCSRTSQM